MKIRQSLKVFLQDNKGFLLFILLMTICRSSLADWYYVPSGSMQPSIEVGDRIFVNKLAYRLEVPFTDIPLMQTGQPERGDIVVFESEKADNRLVKRLIGLPGDNVAMQNNRVFLNGKPLNYSATQMMQDTQATQGAQRYYERVGEIAHLIQLSPKPAADTFAPVTIPQGYCLVLGDNRNNSADSRVYGLVPAQELQGKAVGVFFSLDRDNYYLPRLDRSLMELI